MNSTSIEGALRQLFLRGLCRNPTDVLVKDVYSRKIVVTQYDGNYGNAGLVIALNGSPPRGTIILAESRHDIGFWIPPKVFYIVDEKSRRMGDKQSQVVREFAKAWWRGEIV